MALELEICVIQGDCETFYVSEKTGAYDAALNTGGWGAPNVTIGSVATAVFQITYAGATTPITLNVFPSLPSTNTNGLYQVDVADLGLDELPTGWTRVTYIVTGTSGGSPYTYSTTKLVFFDCEVACCVTNKIIAAAAAVVNGDCCEECKDEKVINALYLEAVLEGARAGTCSGLTDVVTTDVEYLETQCGETPCSDC